MAGVFISYTTRGGISEEWIVNFRKHLETSYVAEYGQPGFKFWEMSSNVGDFQQGINAALKFTTTLVMVLDPLYTQSPQTLDEIALYKQERAVAGNKEFFIKVIKKRGEHESGYRQIVNRNLIPYNLSTLNERNGVEKEFDPDGDEFHEQIQKIVREIKRNETDQQRKINSEKLLSRLTELKDVPKIYVALGDSDLTENRRQFINELNGTISRHSDKKLRLAKVLPDDVTFNTDYEELSDLLCQDNEYRETCLSALLNESVAVIFPFQTDNKTDAEEYLEKVRFQLDAMKLRARNHQLPLHLLLNIPDVMYTISDFKNEFNTPALAAYQHIKIARGQEIINFIAAFIKDLVRLVNPPEAASDSTERRAKQIYLIEYQNPVGTVVSDAQLQAEQENRRQIRSFIEKSAIKVMPELPKTGSIPEEITLKDSTNQRQQLIKESDAVIIYRGIREDDTWCLQQQAQTYREIRALKKDGYNRAVFVDPAQTDKDLYDIYDFKVIKTHPDELNQFLWQVQQH